ncbi:hypothetical protein SELMODRAFT_426190 [Selaginella moellendorffii]|uniref:Uncharacterized protein n=1 Tax=Selaginella moellendorffii TaxID=88036 RepID=D8SVM4_SELML|nr:hypothetical protein SELMODRAFT_426190 [Selaginella moellendorffii]
MGMRRETPVVALVTTGATATRSAAGHAPSATRDDGVKPMSPMPSLDRKPMKARKRPIPAALELELHRCRRGDDEITLRLVQSEYPLLESSPGNNSRASNQALSEPLKNNSRAWTSTASVTAKNFSVPGSFLKGFLMEFCEQLAGVKENEDASTTAQMGGQFVSRPVIWNVEQEQLIAEELALFPRKRCGNRTLLLSATRILYLA